MLLLAKMVCYTKSFMPENTILTSKPARSLIDECNAWDIKMRSLGAVVEENVMYFVNRHQPKKHQSRKPFVQGMMKLLQKIKIVEFPVVNVVDDTVLILARSSCWYFGCISEFRS